VSVAKARFEAKVPFGANWCFLVRRLFVAKNVAKMSAKQWPSRRSRGGIFRKDFYLLWQAGLEMQNECAEIKLRVERRAGELLGENPDIHPGG